MNPTPNRLHGFQRFPRIWGDGERDSQSTDLSLWGRLREISVPLALETGVKARGCPSSRGGQFAVPFAAA